MQNRLIIGPPDNRHNLNGQLNHRRNPGGPEKRVLVGGFYPAADIYQQPEPTGLEVDREYGYDRQEINIESLIPYTTPSSISCLGQLDTSLVS